MNLQKRLASAIADCSPKRVVFNEERLEEIEQAITKSDVRRLMSNGAIVIAQKHGVSRARANMIKEQKAKGRRRGQGSRKGLASARGEDSKRLWINKVRLQRKFITSLRKNSTVDAKLFRDLYRKVKGGFFRSKRHIILYLEEKDILKAKP